MTDILNEAYGVVRCKECPWYKTCVTPMRFTPEDLKRQLEAQASVMGQSPQADNATQNMLSGMAMAAQNSMLEACPVFIDRLRSNQQLSLKLKKLMQDWNKDEIQQ
ncbi:MAG TPA: hypothetical protein VEH58_06300 [Dehalococcoidales bacterium]|nr:hypothetical protein [Dehalococcoidales bacterium]